MDVTSSSDPVVFDHHSPEYARNWREINARLRGTCPVARTDAHGGYWVVSRYADVADVTRDYATFSSYLELPDGEFAGVTIPPAPLRQVPIEMDPPDFFDHRKLLNGWFSPAASAKWEPFLREVTTFCIDSIIETGRGDLVRDICSPVPAILTLKLLGVPTDNWREVSDVTHALVHTVHGTPEGDAAMQGMMQLLDQINDTIAARRAEPTDDLISHLVKAEVNGQPLSEQRLIEMAALVIGGGTDTTGSLLSTVLEWLYRNPEQRRRLADEPELMPRATEEFLRYFSPVAGLARTATKPCTVGGQRLEAGDRLFLSWSSANYDEAVFDRPDEVVLDRFPNRHQSFGLGIHRCLGSNFARLGFQVVLSEVLKRMPDYVIDSAAQPYPSIGIVNGWVSLPAAFTPGARVGSKFGS